MTLRREYNAVDAYKIGLMVEYKERTMPANLVGSTLAIDGHGQPAPKDARVEIVARRVRQNKALRLQSFLQSQGYANVAVAIV